jgi:hypothetical protein
MMPRHFLALQGAQTVKTNALKLTRRAVADLLAVETGAMGVVHGDAGLGRPSLWRRPWPTGLT